MVRVNLFPPEKLADQHLIAEYNEILMLAGYVKKHSNLIGIPERYVLGEGHMKFFKDKIGYLKERHDLITKEMKKRGFNPKKKFNLRTISNKNKKYWTPDKKDFEIIKERIIQKIKYKPEFYRYYGTHKPVSFFINLLE